MNPKSDVGQTMEMYADYEAGMSLAEVGEKYFFKPESVWKRFKNLGLKLRPANKDKRKVQS